MFFARKKRDAALRDTIDRLGDVRSALRILRVREEELLRELESYRPNRDVIADRYQLEIVEKQKRVFDRYALPKKIRDDALYWKQETRRLVTVTPLDRSLKAPSADQIADTYAETYDLPIGLPEDEANYGAPSMPKDSPAPAHPFGEVMSENAEPAPKRDFEVAEPAASFDFAGVPRYRTGGKARPQMDGTKD